MTRDDGQLPAKKLCVKMQLSPFHACTNAPLGLPTQLAYMQVVALLSEYLTCKAYAMLINYAHMLKSVEG